MKNNIITQITDATRNCDYSTLVDIGNKVMNDKNISHEDKTVCIELLMAVNECMIIQQERTRNE